MSPIRLAVAARNRRSRPGRGAALDLVMFNGQVGASSDGAHEVTGAINAGEVTVVGEGALGKQRTTDYPIVTGLRIDNVELPQGVAIAYAHLRFVCRAGNTDPFVVRIQAQAADNAPSFTTTNGDISARALTTAYADWSIPLWTSGQDDADTITVDIAAVVQEVVNRAGWASGNAIVFIIQPAPQDAGTSRRRPYSFDDNPTHAPRLAINTTDPGEPGELEPPPEGEYTLQGDPNFDINSLSGAARTEYDRLLADIASPQTVAWLGDQTQVNHSFRQARVFHNYIQSILHAFRITGDLHLLDHVDEWMEALRDCQVTTGWQSPADHVGRYSGYYLWLSELSYSDLGGTDRNIDDIKIHALVAMVAYALDLNRGYQSPGNRDYGLHADQWKDYLFGSNLAGDGKYAGNSFFEKMTVGWVDPNDGTLYKRYGSGYGFSQFNPHSDAHSWWDYTKLNYFLWRLAGNQWLWDNAKRGADIIWYPQDVQSAPSGSYTGNPEIREAATPDGNAYVWMSQIHWRSASRNYLQAVSYSSSNYNNVLAFHWEGFHEWANPETLPKFARAIEWFHLTDTNNQKYTNPTDIPSSGPVGADVGGTGVDRAGIPAVATHRRDRSTMAGQYAHPQISAWAPSSYVADCYDFVRSQHPDQVTIRTTVGLFIRAFLLSL